MKYSYLPIRDASIYQAYPFLNTGRDEVLEVGKSSDGINAIRSLVQFDLTNISSSFASGLFPSNAQVQLTLFVARADNMNYSQSLQLLPLSQSWIEGTGYFYQSVNGFIDNVPLLGGYIEKDGVTWTNRASGSSWNASGSDYITSSITTGTLADPVTDMTFDVTSLVQLWLSGSIPNNGLLAKFPDADEQDHTIVGDIKFFSRQTHTVYSPLLSVQWNDQVYITGSLTGSNATNILVLPKNLLETYRANEIVRVDLSVRDKYPQRTFGTVFTAYLGNQYLPSSSYYSVVDQQSNVVLIPFDDNARIACDGTSSYCQFRTDGMYAGRYYKLLFKVVNGPSETIYDSGHIFGIAKP